MAPQHREWQWPASPGHHVLGISLYKGIHGIQASHQGEDWPWSLQWDNGKRSGVGAGLHKHLVQSRLTQVQAPATTEPRAAWPGQRGVGLCPAQEASPRLTAGLCPQPGPLAAQVSSLGGQLLAVNSSPPPYTPHSHPPLFTKHFPSVISFAAHQPPGEGRAGWEEGQGGLPSLACS